MGNTKPNTSEAVLDCSQPFTWLFWFIVGAVFALIAMYGLGAKNWASLLRVGADNPARARIESELGPVVSPDRMGHDGQLYYLVARDPFGSDASLRDLVAFDTNPPRYRYRRILFPLLAGGFGQFEGRSTLLGMILCVALGMGLATAATADLTFQMRLPTSTALLAATNVGALASAVILTPDVFALGLALSGVALSGRLKLGAAVSAFALAGLTKEVYLLAPLSVAGWLWGKRLPRQAAAVALIPPIPVILWTIWIWSTIPAVPKSTPLFGLPMLEMFNSLSQWLRLYGDNPVQMVLAVYTVISFIMVVTMLLVGRDSLLRWVAAPWLAVGLCSTGISVWDVPNNVARSFSILWPLGILLVSGRLVRRLYPPELRGTSNAAMKWSDRPKTGSAQRG